MSSPRWTVLAFSISLFLLGVTDGQAQALCCQQFANGSPSCVADADQSAVNSCAMAGGFLTLGPCEPTGECAGPSVIAPTCCQVKVNDDFTFCAADGLSTCAQITALRAAGALDFEAELYVRGECIESGNGGACTGDRVF